MVKKATKAIAKAKMQTSISRNIDQQYYKGNQLIYTIIAKANNQVQFIKNSKAKELKAQGPELLSTL